MPAEPKIPRPRNAFILFRQHYHKILINEWTAKNIEIPHNSEISKLLGNKWKLISAKEKLHWDNLAKQEKLNHEKKFPQYKYRPVRKQKKKFLQLQQQIQQQQQQQQQQQDNPLLPRHSRRAAPGPVRPLVRQGKRHHSRGEAPHRRGPRDAHRDIQRLRLGAPPRPCRERAGGGAHPCIPAVLRREGRVVSAQVPGQLGAGQLGPGNCR